MTSELEPRATARLRELCRIPTVTGDTATMARAADWLLHTYGSDYDVAEVHRDADGAVAGLLLGFEGAERGRLTFFDYLDVVGLGDESSWTAPAFSAPLRDGRIYARGAASNKGDLIARLEAISQVRARGELRRDVAVWIDAAEEHGSPHLGAMLDRWRDQLQADLVIWNTGFVNAAGEPIVGCGFKGVLIVDLSADLEDVAGHSGVGGGASAVHRLLELVQPLVDDAGLTWLDDGARAAEDPEELPLAEAAAILEDGGRSVRRALLQSTANVPWFQGGDREALTRYAGRAACSLELRLVAPHVAQAALDALASRCAAAGVTCTPRMQIEPYTLDRSARAAALKALDGPLSAAFGTPPRLLPIVPFSARAEEVARALGAPVVSVGLTDARSAPHAPDESISHEAFVRSIDFVRRMVGAA